MVLLLAVANAFHQRQSTTARHFQRDGAVYIPNFLDEPAFEEVRRECRRLRSQLKREKNSVANGRLGRVLDRSSTSHATLMGPAMSLRLQSLLSLPTSLEPSEYPVELRHYPQGR